MAGLYDHGMKMCIAVCCREKEKHELRGSISFSLIIIQRYLAVT